MRAQLFVLTALASCHGTAGGYAPVAVPCAFNRVGDVTVTGAPRETVPQLTVLEGTIDDPERTDRIAEIAMRAALIERCDASVAS